MLTHITALGRPSWMLAAAPLLPLLLLLPPLPPPAIPVPLCSSMTFHLVPIVAASKLATPMANWPSPPLLLIVLPRCLAPADLFRGVLMALANHSSLSTADVETCRIACSLAGPPPESPQFQLSPCLVPGWFPMCNTSATRLLWVPLTAYLKVCIPTNSSRTLQIRERANGAHTPCWWRELTATWKPCGTVLLERPNLLAT